MTHKIKNTISIITRIATILLFVSALFLSCQKNNDNEPEDEPSTINKQDLIGTWALDARNYLYEDCFKKQRLIFSENEVVRYYYWFDEKETKCKEEVWKMSYRLSGNKIILKYTKGNAFSHFSQKIEVIGNELHLTYFDNVLSKKTVTKVYKKIVNIVNEKVKNMDEIIENAYNIAKERDLKNVGLQYKNYYEYILGK